MNRIIKILMERDGLSLAEAKEELAFARQGVSDGIDPQEILLGELGLELDYLPDLFDY